jgi:Ca2+-binding RTX toxin-like protein
VSFILGDNVENLTLTGSDPIDGTGNALANILTGNDAANMLDGDSGNDRLFGNGGDDQLYGGLGSDQLQGGAGADDLYGGADLVRDTFIYNSATDSSGPSSPAGWDHIYDFHNHATSGNAGDLIDLRQLDADLVRHGDQAFRFVSAFTDAVGSQAHGQVQVVASGGNMNVEIDFDGDNAADMIIQVMNVTSLTGNDFLL